MFKGEKFNDINKMVDKMERIFNKRLNVNQVT